MTAGRSNKVLRLPFLHMTQIPGEKQEANPRHERKLSA